MQFNDYGVELSSAGKTKIKSMAAKYGTSMSRHMLIDITCRYCKHGVYGDKNGFSLN